MPEPVQHLIQQKRRTHPEFGGTIAKAFSLLACFGDDPRPLGNGDFAQRLGLPRATVSRLCRTLCELGYLAWDSDVDKYVPSVGVLRLGYPYLIGLQLRHIARGPMQALAERFHGAVSMGVAQGSEVIYLESCTFHEGTEARPAPGAARSIMSTAMGRAWLSTLKASELADAFATLQAARPGEYAALLDNVKENIALYPKRGYALNEGDAGRGVRGVGVASQLRYHQRTLLFNVAVPGELATRERLTQELAPALQSLVRHIELLAGTHHSTPGKQYTT